MNPDIPLHEYEILSALGAGGMGEVYLARDSRLNRKVAIKVLRADVFADEQQVRRFEQEARSASALNHPNVCVIHALGDTRDGRRFIAMELIEGQSLRRRLASTRLGLRECLDIAIQVAAGVGAAHAMGIVHRDLKPENVLVRPDGLVKVVDFGLAKMTSDAASSGDARTVLSTDAGIVMGTVVYMAPEQARGKHVDGRADI